MKALFFVLSLLVSSSVYAADMTCAIGVYNAQNIIDEDNDAAFSTVVVPLSAEGGEVEARINGEKVLVNLMKRDHADVYDIYISLMTPEADLNPRQSFIALLTDFLINDGPTRMNSLDLNPGRDHTRYSYMKSDNGFVVLTPKAVQALKTAGVWGKYPLHTSVLHIGSSAVTDAFEHIVKLTEKKVLKPTDVVALSNILSCTKSK